MTKRGGDAKPFWTVDCETDPFKHDRQPKPFIWGLWTGAGYHEFLTVDELVNFIKDCEVIIYAHNGGKFDFHFLLEHINLEEEIKVINGRLVVAHIGKAELRDSYNLLPIPLSAYQKTEIDYSKLEAKVRAQHMPEIRAYLRDDCVFLYNLIAGFEKSYGRNLTMAGASMKQWQEISGLKPPETDRDYFQQFSAYYYGGRVQCFETGVIKGPCKVFDIRSAYPWAMLSRHPYGPEYIATPSPKEICPTSMVTLEAVSRGALPWRSERGAILFPDDGEPRVYTVSGHEVLAGLETGTLERVRYIDSIDHTDQRTFADYINHFYARRKEARAAGDKAETIFCKLFMNSLYGKFGANPDNYGNFICCDFQTMHNTLCNCDNPVCEDYHFDGMIGPHALGRRPLDKWQQKFINVATAASITGQVRAHLWRAICAADRPLYCDTDSIICRDADLPLGEELGHWNFEGTASTVYIGGKKLYLCDGLLDDNGKPKQASKGARLTPQELRRIAAGEEILYKPEAPTFSLLKAPGFVNRRIRRTAGV